MDAGVVRNDYEDGKVEDSPARSARAPGNAPHAGSKATSPENASSRVGLRPRARGQSRCEGILVGGNF